MKTAAPAPGPIQTPGLAPTSTPSPHEQAPGEGASKPLNSLDALFEDEPGTAGNEKGEEQNVTAHYAMSHDLRSYMMYIYISLRTGLAQAGSAAVPEEEKMGE